MIPLILHTISVFHLLVKPVTHITRKIFIKKTNIEINFFYISFQIEYLYETLLLLSFFYSLQYYFSQLFNLTLSVPIPDEERKLTSIFIFTPLCGASKGSTFSFVIITYLLNSICHGGTLSPQRILLLVVGISRILRK